MIRRFALASAIFIAVGSAAPAMAGTATSNLTVSSSVPNNCTISTASIDFGNYDPVDANTSTSATATGTVTVTCTSGASANIKLSQGSNADPDSTDPIPMRRLANGSNYLSYGLYQDSNLTTLWGNTAGTGASHTGTGSASNVTVYGVISPGQNVPAGSYADTVVAEVSF
ncbi:spore coat U domain-containing protein [Dolichospermum circinale]|uniref:Csu type fimbrial protein n=1 Tax=Dolichospermum circinale TaxID=109265 RepID=UPI00232E7A0C|nr:spore coat U domain-containing protein [Dolichospermum circinale]MDB9453449.1 spore coat U domain-containing protein [Dolichospermum circinale CS-541/06]MDB9464443.1 spore coat U domain-containing protein [Dolichospermum circinale CS-541/04]MDB9549491.1 spore coat U domain-containing protein [Dolichospermum circinale CS-1031]